MSRSAGVAQEKEEDEGNVRTKQKHHQDRAAGVSWNTQAHLGPSHEIRRPHMQLSKEARQATYLLRKVKANQLDGEFPREGNKKIPGDEGVWS